VSFQTGSVTELLYASTASGATLSTFTTEAQLNTTATMGVQCHLPPDFWLPNQSQVGRGIRVVARGVLGTAGSAPTFTFSLRGGTSGNASTAPLLAATAASTFAASLTAVPWEFEVDLILSAISAAGANSTLKGMGMLSIGGLTGSGWAIWGGGTSPGTVATLDTSVTNYLNFNVACGTSNASNTVTLHQLLVHGLN
jgi:hypothetical protein